MMKASSANDAPNHQMLCQPNDLSSSPARLYMMKLPTGTHDAQMPMGVPRFSGGNHMLMTAGAMTVIRPRPMPSIARPPSNITGLAANAPTIDPSKVQPIAMRPEIFGPSLASTN